MDEKTEKIILDSLSSDDRKLLSRRLEAEYLKANILGKEKLRKENPDHDGLFDFLDEEESKPKKPD